jgi:hypothetical protein
MTCVNRRKLPFAWNHCECTTVLIVYVFTLLANVVGQLDLPPLPQVSSSPRPGDQYLNQYNGISTARPFGSPVNQFNGPFSSTPRPDVYSTSPRYQQDFNRGINPDVTNRGYTNLQNGGVDPANPDRVYNGNRGFDDRNVDGRNPGGLDGTNYADSDRDDYNRDQNGFGNSFQGGRQGPYGRDTTALRRFLAQVDSQATEECTNNVAAQWNFETDVNEVTQLAAVSFHPIISFPL